MRLRAWADEWDIDILEIDLRWGIPREPGVSALHECLRHVGECQPFFVGLLGHRYGSSMVLGDVDQSTLQAYPWLAAEPWDGRSYTELEFAVAILRPSSVPVGALVYCRSEELSRKLDAALPTGFGAPEDPQSKLKERIRALGAIKRPDYTSVEELGFWIEEDIKNEIQQRYASWFRDHRRLRLRTGIKFGLGRARSFVGPAWWFLRLNRALVARGKPVLVLAEPGTGRTALLQTWCMLLAGDRPVAWQVRSFWGAGQRGADSVGAACALAGSRLAACLALDAAPAGIASGWVPIAAGLLEALRETAGETHSAEAGSDPVAVRQALAVCLARWPEGMHVLICLDDADLLAGDLTEDPLAWLPASLPDSMHLVISMRDSKKSRELARRRNWRVLKIPPLKPKLRQEIAVTHFKAFGKQLGERMARQIAKELSSSRPNSLLAALEDLRFLQQLSASRPGAPRTNVAAGALGALDERLPELCRAGSDEGLQLLVLSSLRARFQSVQPGRDLAGDALRLLVCARSGLAESEIVMLLGRNNAPLPSVVWLPLRGQAGAFLNEYGGRLFPARSMRALIERELLNPAGRSSEAHGHGDGPAAGRGIDRSCLPATGPVEACSPAPSAGGRFSRAIGRPLRPTSRTRSPSIRSASSREPAGRRPTAAPAVCAVRDFGRALGQN